MNPIDKVIYGKPSSTQVQYPCYRKGIKISLSFFGVLTFKKGDFVAGRFIQITKNSHEKQSRNFVMQYENSRTYSKKKISNMESKSRTKKRKLRKNFKKFYKIKLKKLKTLASTIRIAESTRKFPELASKPAKHKQITENLTIQFLPRKYFNFIRKKQGPVGTLTPDLRVRRKPCYLHAMWEVVSNFLRFTNKANSHFFTAL